MTSGAMRCVQCSSQIDTTNTQHFYRPDIRMSMLSICDKHAVQCEPLSRFKDASHCVGCVGFQTEFENVFSEFCTYCSSNSTFYFV